VSDTELLAARQVADQLTIALANTRLVRRLDRMSWGTVAALARAIDAKSPWTAGHSERVAQLSLALGRRLRLDPATLEDLHRGSLLHDVGKIGVAAAVLDKPGDLTPPEREAMRSHVVVGAEILSPIPAYTGALPVVRSHHERWDGLGYPDGLRGEAIPLLARVLSVADTFDALTSDRPYRRGLTPGEALARLRSLAGSQFDPLVVDALLAEMGERGVQPDPGPARA
jgi:putative nucleotidyltransferase with HDIG domain